MTGELHLGIGHVVISRDIIMNDEVVGVLSYFERFGRTWVDLAMHPNLTGLGYETEALKIVIDRMTEMKVPVLSMRINYLDDYLGSLLMNELGFNVFQISDGSTLLEKQLL